MNAVNEHKKFGMAIEKWRVLMLAAFAVLAAGGFLCSVLSGAVAIPVSALGDILNGGGDNASRQILLNIRLPRAIVAALVGMNLAVSGAVKIRWQTLILSAFLQARGWQAFLL